MPEYKQQQSFLAFFLHDFPSLPPLPSVSQTTASPFLLCRYDTANRQLPTLTPHATTSDTTKMRPAHADEAEMLAYWKLVMILNKTLHGPAYVESLVSQCPGVITTNTQGRKTLPPELWYMILDFIVNDPDPHDFALLQPVHLETIGRRNKTLICAKFERWRSMGLLNNEAQVVAASKYLARPDLRFDGLDRPFLSVQVPNSRWKIPARVLSSKIKAVHVAITVPDVIKYLEGGSCFLCRDKRCVADELNFFYPKRRGFYNIRDTALCPLCVGLEYAEQSLEKGQKSSPLTYLEWLAQTLESLGHDPSRIHDTYLAWQVRHYPAFYMSNIYWF
jgi:hypothetical protein